MVQTQIDQLTKVQKDLLVNAAREKQACEIRTRSGATTQDPSIILLKQLTTNGLD
jgi:hypothetical protein